VTVYIVDDHEEKKERQVVKSYRKSEEEYYYNTHFHDGFEGMEGIGCPGGGIGGLMVNKVKIPEDAGVMHEAMGPVEVSIMQE